MDKHDRREAEFAAWLSAPVEYTSPDPRFEVRRAVPADFPRIYANVDTVFERHRARSAYDWLYLQNPAGIARCRIVLERNSGNLVSSASSFPWPVARGNRRIPAVIGGDAATLPAWQRKGLSEVRRGLDRAHPFYDATLGLGIPNYKSRAAGVKYDLTRPFGPLTGATLVLNWPKYLQAHSVPRPLARLAGEPADGVQRRWLRARLKADRHIRTEAVTRFESAVDAVTQECMAVAGYWCPHDAEFLNWRYLASPLFSYLAQIVVLSDCIRGYGVIRVERTQALLMEFAAPAQEPGVGRALLTGLISTAREAGCDRMDFHATRGWRFWPLLWQVGFRKRTSSVHVTARFSEDPEAGQEDRWQLLPGDSDVT